MRLPAIAAPLGAVAPILPGQAQSRAGLPARVVRGGKPIDLIVEGCGLARVTERPGTTLAQSLGDGIATPPGMAPNTGEAKGAALAWPTRPPYRGLPGEDIPDPGVLPLVLP